MKYVQTHKIILLSALALCLALALLSLSALLRPLTASADDQTLPSAGGELAEGSYTLGADVALDKTLTISGNVTIDLNGHALSLKEGETGSVIQLLSGSLTLGSSAAQGEIKGGDSATGGGVYAAGRLTLSGDVRITDNRGSNLYLSNGNKILLNNFTGNVGISMNTFGEFTDDVTAGGTFTADNRAYTVEGNKLVFAKLQSITATYKNSEKVFPTTELDSLKDKVTVTAANSNGVAYAGKYDYTLTGELHVGKSILTVTATGEDEETAATTVEIEVSRPSLTSIDAKYEQKTPVYFNSELTLLADDLTVTGHYDDGKERQIFRSPTETSAGCGEEYIQDIYYLAGDLSKRTNGVSEIVVTAGNVSAKIEVPVSRLSLSADAFEVADLTIVQQTGAWNVDPSSFVKNLPQGVAVTATVNGEPVNARALPPAVYTVLLSFVGSGEDYEPITGTRTATLTVNRTGYSVSGESGALLFSAERDGGIPPLWEFEVKEVSAKADLDGEEIGQAYELTLKEEGLVVTGEKVRVKLLIADKLKDKEFKLYRVLADGTAVEVNFTRDGDFFAFEESEFTHACYALAVKSDRGVYIALAVCFGIACAAGAGVLIWYFVVKRKMKIKN